MSAGGTCLEPVRRRPAPQDPRGRHGRRRHRTYHPTFLYESLWNLAVAAPVVLADRRWRLGGGKAFALYLALYATGRLWIDGLRIDDAAELYGLRLSQYVMVVVLLGAVACLGRGRDVAREPAAALRGEGGLVASGSVP